MSQRLIIRCDELLDTISWGVFSKTGELLNGARQVPLANLPPLNPWILVPGTWTLLTEVMVSTRHKPSIMQAVPYLLEEQLAAEVETLHFALGARQSSTGHIAVAVIAKTLMGDIMQRYQSYSPIAVIPEVLAIPWYPDGWSIMGWDKLILVRTGLYTGFAIELPQLEWALAAALQVETPLTLYILSGPVSPSWLSQCAQWQLPWVEKQAEQGEFFWFHQGILQNNFLNLLQNTYRPVSKMVALAHPWKGTLGLASLTLLLYGAIQWVDSQALLQKREMLHAHIEKLYRDTFPQAQKIVNPRLQMEQHLIALRKQQQKLATTEQFLTSLAQISLPFQTLADAQTVTLKEISYQRNAFQLELTVANWQVLDQLRQQFNQLGFKVKIQTATHQQYYIESRLRLEKNK